MRSKLKEFFLAIKNTIIEEYKFIIFLVLLFIILQFPLNYYITTGGGISDISSRIEVSDKYKSKGSFNISYVTQLKGTVITYVLSYIIPSWDRESTSDYKYDESENIHDIEFRNNLDLKVANGNATYWAYTLAKKDVKEVSNKIYVITVFNKSNTKLRVKDVIVSIDDKSFSDVMDYRQYLQTKKEYDIVKVKVIRNNKEIVVDQKLKKENNQIIMGVGLQQVHKYEVDPPVSIKFKKHESGPSGGLITTLEIYNQLTKKDITKGLKIAGTGTIESDGSIGTIGGVKYKLLGAVKDKADIFLVPSGKNYMEAKKYLKEKNYKMKLVKVKTIKDAIRELEG